MNLTVRLLGLELLSISASTDDDTDVDLSGGTTASTAMGFTLDAGEQREPGTER